MSLDIIEDRLRHYSPRSQQEEINALKEIYQEIALAGLARADFFKIGAFQGGTCLRILYGLRRFSEDLDFLLQKSEQTFQWHPFLRSIDLEFRSFGLALEVKDRSDSKGVLKKAFLKDDSFGQIIELRHPLLPSHRQKIQIKLEIDINPPEGSQFSSHYLIYPFPFSIVAQDLPSLFASKCHALLCRPYIKGRDWFDFLWYLTRDTPLNQTHLQKALEQTGPLPPARDFFSWFLAQMRKKIESIDWNQARRDVENFLTEGDRKQTEAWSQSLFLHAVDRLASKNVSI